MAGPAFTRAKRILIAVEDWDGNIIILETKGNIKDATVEATPIYADPLNYFPPSHVIRNPDPEGYDLQVNAEIRGEDEEGKYFMVHTDTEWPRW